MHIQLSASVAPSVCPVVETATILTPEPPILSEFAGGKTI